MARATADALGHVLNVVCLWLCSSRDVQIALNPDQLVEQLGDEEALKERYEKAVEVRTPPCLS